MITLSSLAPQCMALETHQAVLVFGLIQVDPIYIYIIYVYILYIYIYIFIHPMNDVQDRFIERTIGSDCFKSAL